MLEFILFTQCRTKNIYYLQKYDGLSAPSSQISDKSDYILCIDTYTKP